MALQQLLAQFSYPAIFLLLLGSGLGLPLSEDVILIATGALSAKGLLHPLGGIAAGYAGLLAGDFALYSIGRKLGRKALESKRVARICPPARLLAIERRFARFGPLVVFGARFVAGLRAATFFSAGVLGVPRKRFLLADAAAAAIWVPALIYLARSGASLMDASLLPLAKTVGAAVGLGLFAGVLARWLVRPAAAGAIVAVEREVEDAGP